MNTLDKERINYLALNLAERAEKERRLEEVQREILELRTRADALQKFIDDKEQIYNEVLNGGPIPPPQPGSDERDDVPMTPDGFITWPQ